ncbi:MAG: hypothetical protein ABW146_06095 [Candidatus Sedimenticola sp. 6PFRAG7]
MDYTAIAGAVDWSQVLVGLSAVAVAIAGIYVAVKGAGMLLNFIRSGR